MNDECNIFVQSCKEKGPMWGRPSLSSKREKYICGASVLHQHQLTCLLPRENILKDKQPYSVKTKASTQLLKATFGAVSSLVGRDDDNTIYKSTNFFYYLHIYIYLYISYCLK